MNETVGSPDDSLFLLPGKARVGNIVQSVMTTRQRLTLLAAFAVLVVLRLPGTWHYGRFLDEEGSVFFAYAWHRPAITALFRSFGGYLNIGANGSTLLAAKMVRAGVMQLEFAPYLTMTIALVFQLLPAIILLNGRGTWLAHRWAIIVSLLIVATAPMTEEVFLNVLHIQFQLALCVALILALDMPRSVGARVGYGVILLVAPLCGPAAIILAPLFALRTLIDQSVARLVQTALFAIGIALQLALFFTPSVVRGDLLDPITLIAIMAVRLVFLPFFTPILANHLGRWVYLSPKIGAWSAAIIGAGYFCALIVSAGRDRRGGAIWLAASGLLMAAVSFGGGMIVSDPGQWYSVGSGERYNFLPLVLLGLALVGVAGQPGVRRRRVWLGLLTMTLLSGAISYVIPLREMNEGPIWPDEVAAWRLDHRHPLATWPTTWTIDLTDDDRPCHPLRSGKMTTADPSYCESAWLVRVAGAVRPTACHANDRSIGNGRRLLAVKTRPAYCTADQGVSTR